MKKLVFIALIFLLFYTRFVNLGWGLPYPMHPDERNMAIAVQSLNCNFKFQISNFKLNECFNPHFFAYGQLPLYLAYGGVQVFHVEPTLALRAISTFSSLLLVFVLMKIVEIVFLFKKKLLDIQTFRLWTLIFLIFQPYAIQFAHFGTTESLLMLLYALIIYFSLQLKTGQRPISTVIILGILSGLSLGTKTSSILFFGVPLASIFIHILVSGKKNRIFHRIFHLFSYLLAYFVLTICFFILSSPHSILNWNEFISSMNYESAVGLGTFVPFYTRQFVGTIPVLFQFQKILPPVLGLPQLVMSLLGFIFLPSYIVSFIIFQVAKLKGPTTRGKSARQQAWQLLSTGGKPSILTESEKSIQIKFDILRFALLISFIPPSFFFAKWTRFIAPSFPLFSLFAILFYIHLCLKVTSYKLQVIKWIIFFLLLIPGIAFLSIYLSPDVRFTASEWIYKNIPPNSKILSETANVIDIPVPNPSASSGQAYTLQPKTYQLISFNFYDLDVDPQLQFVLSEALKQADYIFVPSRRIYKNYDRAHYPLLNRYYSDLFSGKSGFEKVAEFSSYPKLGPWAFPDEEAEETWTVFDHPVIRIYKRSQKSESLEVSKSENQRQQPELDFSEYKTTSFRLSTFDFRLLIADTPAQWEKGLMYVGNKEDIGGLDGMLFQFPDSAPRTFWNKNTFSHLTLYWMNEGKIIGISDLPSITESKEIVTVSSPSYADEVIEVLKKETVSQTH